MKTSFPKEKIRVLLLENVHPVAKQVLSDEGFTVVTSDKALEGAALARALGDAGGVHLLGIRSKTTLDDKALGASPRLLGVGCFCIGTNQVELDAARSRGIAVFNSPFSNTRSVAELTLAEILALHRRLLDQSAKMHRGEWDKSAAGAHEVRGRTLGIVGYGHIGSQVSILAEALGMRVLFYDLLPKLALGNARACRSLEELLKHADVLTLHVPATPATKNMIAREQLKLMRRGSMLINNARGSIVHVGALAGAIRDGHLAGAALDVFPHEPAGKDEAFASELQGLPNVILTPHVGGSTEEAQRAIAEDVVGKLVTFLNVGSTTASVNMPILDLPPQASASAGKGRSHRILHTHRNVPGVLKKINTLVGDLGVNINAQYLMTREEIGYAVLDVDPSQGKKIEAGLRGLDETVRVRVLW